MIVYVDDILVGSIVEKETDKVFDYLIEKGMEVKSMSEPSEFLRMRIAQKNNHYYLSQTKEIKKLTKMFLGNTEVRSASRPLPGRVLT